MNLTNMLGFLAPVLGLALKGLYMLLKNYGWAIILFTFVIRLASFPLTLMQQKSTARNAAFQPMLDEIRKKWANDKNRMNEETMKFQQENNMKMTAGCLPSIVSMLIMFSMIAVIQSPMKYMLSVPQEQIDSGIKIVQSYYNEEDSKRINYNTQESILIGEIRENPEKFIDGVDVKVDGKTVHYSIDEEYVEAIKDFNFDFMGMNLSHIPSFGNWVTMILPLVSILTSILFQVIMQLTSGQKQSMMMMVSMMLMTVVMFGFYAFAAPVGFSLYYTVSNIAQIVQQYLVKKIHDPEVEKKKVLDEIEARRKEKHAKKKIVVEEKGKKVTKDVKQSEMDRLRLEMARKLDDEMYAQEDADEEEKEAEKEAELAEGESLKDVKKGGKA